MGQGKTTTFTHLLWGKHRTWLRFRTIVLLGSLPVTQCSLEIAYLMSKLSFYEGFLLLLSWEADREVEVGNTLCNLSLQIEASQEPKPKSSFLGSQKREESSQVRKQSSLLAGEDL